MDKPARRQERSSILALAVFLALSLPVRAQSTVPS